MIDRDQDIIIAQCTPKGSGALAMLRLCGNGVFDLVNTMSKLASGKKIIDVSSHTIHYGQLLAADHSVLDQVLFMVMHGPKTFTGQDTVEISCHNNQFLIEQIIQCAVACGARLAEHGEFSKRAYLNGKIDLVQAEAINELIMASNEITLKQSLAQLEGSLSQKIIYFQECLLKALALSDASFEFLDEENVEFGDQIRTLLDKVIKEISVFKQTFDQQKYIREGIRIALIGSVNAGKSSLFNLLIGHERAIVHTRAGTTRDVIESGMYQNGFYVTYVDTAGLRQTEDDIEQEGIERSYQEAVKADLILLVYDQSRQFISAEQDIYDDMQKKYADKILAIANKSDQPSQLSISKDMICISTHTKQGLEQVQQIIKDRIAQLCTAQASPFMLNRRHMYVLLELEKRLGVIQQLLIQEPIAYELISYHLHDALQLMSELIGKDISDKAMDTIFKEFCIGK